MSTIEVKGRIDQMYPVPGKRPIALQIQFADGSRDEEPLVIFVTRDELVSGGYFPGMAVIVEIRPEVEIPTN